jgi:hypothetical protein
MLKIETSFVPAANVFGEEKNKEKCSIQRNHAFAPANR